MAREGGGFIMVDRERFLGCEKGEGEEIGRREVGVTVPSRASLLL